jgi:AraC-like DNA-binding protein
MINEMFVPLRITPLGGTRREQGFCGSVRMREVGELRTARVRANPMAALHSDRHVDATEEDDYFLALHLRGIAHAAQDGRRVALHAGDFALFDSTRPYAIEFRDSGVFEHLIYRIPRRALDARCTGLERATAVRVALSSSEGQLTAPYLNRLARLATPVAGACADRLAATALDLLATALTAAAGLQSHPEPRRMSLLAQVKQQTLARLGDQDLSPASIARAQFISVRALHRLFEHEQMTFGAFVREERLRRCRTDLADPRLTTTSIAEIASRWGYRSPAHFSRAFTARYAIRPHDFRRSAAHGPA